MSILTIVQDVMVEQGLAKPSLLFDSSDPTADRLIALAKRTGEALYRAHDWTVLHREHTFTTSDGVSNYAVPEDWGRPIGSTAWDRDTFFRMRGNLTPQQWQALKSGLTASTSLSFSFRLLVGPLAGSILLDPTPDGASDLVIEYVTKFWSEDSSGTGQATLAADDDDIRMDHELFTLGLTWRVKRAFGMPYADERSDYEIALKTAQGSDLNLPKICMGGRRPFRPVANLPEGSFGT